MENPLDDTLFDLLEAVQSNNYNKVKEIIDTGFNVNYHTPAKETALMYATDVRIANLLISANANVNVANNSGMTPLHHAANFDDNPEIVSLLIANGANINAQNNSGNTPVMEATTPEILKLLIAANADLNIKNNEYMNALRYAVNYYTEDKQRIMLLENEMRFQLRKAFISLLEGIPPDDELFHVDESGKLRNIDENGNITKLTNRQKIEYDILRSITDPIQARNVLSFIDIDQDNYRPYEEDANQYYEDEEEEEEEEEERGGKRRHRKSKKPRKPKSRRRRRTRRRTRTLGKSK